MGYNMSRTDKTDPYYVKLHRYGVEEHDHINGECDYDPDENLHDPGNWRARKYTWRSCTKTQPNASYTRNNWFARPKAVRIVANYQHRSERRKVKEMLAKGEYDSVPMHRTGRGNALWICY
jgi:hypothetical protein